MHYSILVPVKVPREEENTDENTVVKGLIETLTQKMNESEKKDIIASIYRDRLYARQSTFARNVADAVDEAMEPYAEHTENPEYLEFWKEDDLEEQYEDDVEDCYKTPDGRIVLGSELNYKFVIRDGKVFQRRAGPSHHEMRTKKAKKYKALPNYPLKKLYQTFGEYAERYHGCVYNEEERGYGYYSNPNAFYDWYVIGGRWPCVFLVKDTCEEYSPGERYRDKEEAGAPEGYIWVSAARKKDVEWELMMKLEKEESLKYYDIYKQAFIEQKLPEDHHGRIKEDGIYGFDYVYYRKDETLEEFMHRRCLNGRHIYPPMFFGMLKPDGYYSMDDMRHHKKTKKSDIDNAMCRKMDDFIGGLDDETVLVAVDIHM